MTKELSIISDNALMEVSKNDINSIISKMVDASKENYEEISELTLECTSLLSSSENRSVALSEQSIFKKLIYNITGKNNKLRDYILKNQTNALYAAQSTLNCVMRECNNNLKLMIAVNDRVSGIYFELKEDQNNISTEVLMVRKALVAFYKQNMQELINQNNRIVKVEEFAKSFCPRCHNSLLSWQRVCPYCGEMHYLKKDNLSDETLKILNRLSEIIRQDNNYQYITWSKSAQKKARILTKVLQMAELGKIPGFTSEIKADIKALINKCKSEKFQIAIVGVMKAGKSFLMNALIGEEIASVEVNPETAALTKFRSANGYYVKISFQNNKEWAKLKNSVLRSKKNGKDSLKNMMEQPEIEDMEKKWVNQNDLLITCSDVWELKNTVKKYTSSRELEHLFVSEVEVGIDSSVFNMPHEVIFVDTPGLQDPVKYRSDITRKYIKEADAVLIAVPTAALTVEGNKVITTVLDYIDSHKAYIVATQKDLKDSDDCEKVISLWGKHLVDAKRYVNERTARNRIMLTSAKMDLLINKWTNLDEDLRNDTNYFSDSDYSALESYVKRVLNNRRYDINRLPYDDESVQMVKMDAGIDILKIKLENSLIRKHRELKLAEIEKDFARCKKQICDICVGAIEKQQESIKLVQQDAEILKEKLYAVLLEKKVAEEADLEIKNAAEILEKELSHVILELERRAN